MPKPTQSNRINWMEGEMTDEQRDKLIEMGLIFECPNCDSWHIVEEEKYKGDESPEAYEAMFARIDQIKTVATGVMEGMAMLLVRANYQLKKQPDQPADN